MTERENQSKFVRMIADLILFAYDQGYELTFGDAWAKTGHAPNSFHYRRLAIDLNLFKDGAWLQDTESFKPLGEYWKAQGGTWGGDFKKADGNHFSLGE
jgi:hypothetical protein